MLEIPQTTIVWQLCAPCRAARTLAYSIRYEPRACDLPQHIFIRGTPCVNRICAGPDHRRAAGGMRRQRRRMRRRSTPKRNSMPQIIFGDSLADVGTYAVGAVAAAGGGKYTINGDNTAINPALTGKIWTELIAAHLGLPAPCAAQTGLDGDAALGFSVPVVNHRRLLRLCAGRRARDQSGRPAQQADRFAARPADRAGGDPDRQPPGRSPAANSRATKWSSSWRAATMRSSCSISSRPAPPRPARRPARPSSPARWSARWRQAPAIPRRPPPPSAPRCRPNRRAPATPTPAWCRRR